MEVALSIAPDKIDEIGYFAHAESLGYSTVWVTDTQMIWSDCFAVMALARVPERDEGEVPAHRGVRATGHVEAVNEAAGRLARAPRRDDRRSRMTRTGEPR